jgi:hypothetical protein
MPTGQRGTLESPIQANCQDKKAMKSVMRTIVRIVIINKRNRTIRLNQKVWNQTIMTRVTL